MELEWYEDKVQKRTVVKLIFDDFEVSDAYYSLHPIHRQLIGDYFKDESSISEKIFALSEIIRVLEEKEDEKTKH